MALGQDAKTNNLEKKFGVFIQSLYVECTHHENMSI